MRKKIYIKIYKKICLHNGNHFTACEMILLFLLCLLQNSSDLYKLMYDSRSMNS